MKTSFDKWWSRVELMPMWPGHRFNDYRHYVGVVAHKAYLRGRRDGRWAERRKADALLSFYTYGMAGKRNE